MKIKKFKILLIIISTMVILVSCMPGSGSATTDEPARFFTGVWHGWIAPFSLITGLFNPNIRVYEVNNIGWIYDLGFYMAIISGFGGLSLFRKNKSKEKMN